MTDENEEVLDGLDEFDTLFEGEEAEDIPEDSPVEGEPEIPDAEIAEGAEIPEESEPPADEEPKEPTLVPIAALHDTRRKLAEERKANEDLRGQLPKTDQKPDMYEDPEGYEAWVRADALAGVQADRQAEEAKRVEQSQESMLESHPDYKEVENVFMFMARNNQDLVDEMLSNPNPAKFAYDKGNEYLKSQKDTMRAEILAESGVAPIEPVKPSVPGVPSLANASAPTNTVHVEKDEDMDEMFDGLKY